MDGVLVLLLVFNAILKSIFPVKPPEINLALSNEFIAFKLIPLSKILFGVVSEIIVQFIPSKVFHVDLLSNDIKQFIKVSSGLVYKTLIFSNLSTGMLLKLFVSTASIQPVFNS